MASRWDRLMSATAAAYAAFRRTYSDPQAAPDRAAWLSRRGHYDHLWALYTNSKYDDLAQWASYKNRYGLYRYVRSVYNPARRLADFYAGIIYPGTLTHDAGRLPNGARIAIPLGEDTPPALVEAIGQIWQWSNWAAGKSLIARWGAALGNVGIEIVDDVERGKVRIEAVWPGAVDALDLDPVGNVKAYALEYEILDAEGKARTYRREVDPETIRTFQDGQPYGYDGNPAEWANPYGFAPMVWIPHTHAGGSFGEPALRNLGKLDELNSLVSVALDRIIGVMASPILIAGGGSIAPISGTGASGSTHLDADPQSGRDRIPVVQGPHESTIEQIAPEGITEASLLIDALLREIEGDHPELTLYRELRGMSHVTGPGAERMLGDAAALIQDARTNYDVHTTKILQMAVAVGGWRASSGAWDRGGSLTRQQAKLVGFGLDSYQRGDLDFEIMPRPIIPETPREQAERERLELALERDRAAGNSAAGIEARILAQAEQGRA